VSLHAATRTDLSDAAVEKLEARIARVVKFEEVERRMTGTTIADTCDDRLDGQMRSDSLLRAIAAQIPGSGQACRRREPGSNLIAIDHLGNKFSTRCTLSGRASRRRARAA
jgi:hypothetical protein